MRLSAALSLKNDDFQKRRFLPILGKIEKVLYTFLSNLYKTEAFFAKKDTFLQNPPYTHTLPMGAIGAFLTNLVKSFGRFDPFYPILSPVYGGLRVPPYLNNTLLATIGGHPPQTP